MDKNELLDIVRYGSTDAEAANKLLALREKFPYSQLLHMLAARLTNDQKLSSAQSSLQLAAVYSSDRHVLKELMSFEYPTVRRGIESEQTENPSVNVVAAKEEKVVEQPLPPGAVKLESVTPPTPPVENPAPVIEKIVERDTTGIDVAELVIADLRKLRTLKHNFEMLFADHTTVSVPVSEDAPKSRKERIKELAKAVSNEPYEPTVKRKKKEGAENIIDEIQTTKEELAPETERLKEQIQIIDHFIKTQPSISNPKERSIAPSTDLNSIKSGEFGENIVSETLVEILVKQGKKDRAIEVLKKLIWKYPQKKAYFASQIEELKK